MEVMTKKFIKKSDNECFIEYSFYMLKWGVIFNISVFDENNKFLCTTYMKNHRNKIDESCKKCFKRVIATKQQKYDFNDSHATFHGMRELLT